jgi:hypothetical protein
MKTKDEKRNAGRKRVAGCSVVAAMGAAWGSEGVRRTDYRIEQLRGTVHRRPAADPSPLQCSDGAQEDRQEDISIGG